MKALLEQKLTRREFVRTVVRYSLLGVALLLTRVFAMRQTGNPANCSKVGVCKSCAVFHNCGQPQADAARKVAV